MQAVACGQQWFTATNLLWVILAAALCGAAYVVVKRYSGEQQEPGWRRRATGNPEWESVSLFDEFGEDVEE